MSGVGSGAFGAGETGTQLSTSATRGRCERFAHAIVSKAVAVKALETPAQTDQIYSENSAVSR
jgi:hypothetical protein